MAAFSEKKISRSGAGSFVILVILVFVGFLMVIPLVYALLQSLKPLDEIYIFPPRFFVRRPTLENYSVLFKITNNLWVPFSRYAFNSLFVVTVCASCQVIFAMMAAYPLTKKQFRGKSVIFNIIVISLLFTGEVTFIPQYILVSFLGLIDSYWALILPSVAFPLGLYLMRQNLVAFPDSIIESAKIDGAPERVVFWRVVIPSVKPVWMTMIMFSFGPLWNRADTSFIYSEELKNLTTLLSQISASGIARVGMGAAAVVLLMIPPAVLFLITQGNVVETMSNSGMKE